jgi:hypothetical protein
VAAGSRDARYFAVLLRCLAKRDGQDPVPSLTPLGPAKTLANPKLQALYMDQVSTRNESLPNLEFPAPLGIGKR